MRRLHLALAATALLVPAPELAAETLVERADRALVRITKDRVPGAPVACISPYRRNRLQVVTFLGVVYRRGDVIYVARAQDPRSIGIDYFLVLDQDTATLCHGDISLSRNRQGFSRRVVLGPFVPYTKVD